MYKTKILVDESCIASVEMVGIIREMSYRDGVGNIPIITVLPSGERTYERTWPNLAVATEYIDFVRTQSGVLTAEILA